MANLSHLEMNLHQSRNQFSGLIPGGEHDEGRGRWQFFFMHLEPRFRFMGSNITCFRFIGSNRTHKSIFNFIWNLKFDFWVPIEPKNVFLSSILATKKKKVSTFMDGLSKNTYTSIDGQVKNISLKMIVGVIWSLLILLITNNILRQFLTGLNEDYISV